MASPNRTGKVRTPTAIRDLRGTQRADRARPLEPKLPKVMPDRPSWIDDDPVGASLFDQMSEYIVNMGVASNLDGLAISLMADQMALYLDLRKRIQQEGSIVTVDGSKGQLVQKANPAVNEANKAFNNVFKMLREYGMTAASRSHVEVPEKEVVDDFETFLNT